MEEESVASWIDMPDDVTANIIERVGAVEIMESAEKVCSSWRKICHEILQKQNPGMWDVIHVKNLNICRRALDCSRGQLVDLGIQNFGDDNLLEYIVHRSRGLKRLTLYGCCFGLTGKGLVKALKMLPQLEYFHVSILPKCQAGSTSKAVGAQAIANSIAESIDNEVTDAMEDIRDSCPNLKTFEICLSFSCRPNDLESLDDIMAIEPYGSLVDAMIIV